MPDKAKGRTFAERLYNANILPDGNLISSNVIEVVSLKIETDAKKDEDTEEEEGI